MTFTPALVAGFVLTLTSLPNMTFTPALVAGFVLVLMRHKPGTVKMPVFFNAATGKAFTKVLAGFALTLTSLPNMTFTPALVAGFVRVLMRHKPGTVKMPVFFTSFAAMSTRLLNTLEHSLVFKPCSSAIAFRNAPLLMAFAPAFMDFIAFMGAMLLHGEEANFDRRRRAVRCT